MELAAGPGGILLPGGASGVLGDRVVGGGVALGERSVVAVVGGLPGVAGVAPPRVVVPWRRPSERVCLAPLAGVRAVPGACGLREGGSGLVFWLLAPSGRLTHGSGSRRDPPVRRWTPESPRVAFWRCLFFPGWIGWMDGRERDRRWHRSCFPRCCGHGLGPCLLGTDGCWSRAWAARGGRGRCPWTGGTQHGVTDVVQAAAEGLRVAGGGSPRQRSWSWSPPARLGCSARQFVLSLGRSREKKKRAADPAETARKEKEANKKQTKTTKKKEKSTKSGKRQGNELVGKRNLDS